MNINNGVKRWEVTAFVCTCWTKTDIMKGSNKRKSFVEHMGMNGSNFKNCVHVKLYRITFRYSFRSGNRCGRVEEWARVTTSMCNNEHESKKRKHTHTYIYIYIPADQPPWMRPCLEEKLENKTDSITVCHDCQNCFQNRSFQQAMLPPLLAIGLLSWDQSIA